MQRGPEWVTVTYQITSLLLKRAFIINLQWSLFYICLFMWQHYMTVVMFVCVCVCVLNSCRRQIAEGFCLLQGQACPSLQASAL